MVETACASMSMSVYALLYRNDGPFLLLFCARVYVVPVYALVHPIGMGRPSCCGVCVII